MNNEIKDDTNTYDTKIKCNSNILEQLVNKYYLEPIISSLTLEECHKLINIINDIDPSSNILVKAFINSVNSSYNYKFTHSKSYTIPAKKSYIYDMLETTNRDQQTLNFVELAKRYYRKDELKHVIHLTYLSSKRKYKLILEYPLQDLSYSYRRPIGILLFTNLFISGQPTKTQFIDHINKYIESLNNDPFVLALSQIANITLSQKVNEIIIIRLIRLRANLVNEASSYRDFIKNILEPYIIEYYTFKHSSEYTHNQILDIINIIDNNYHSYRKKIISKILNRITDTDGDCILDIFIIYTRNKEYTDEFWQIIFHNMDKVITLRNSKSGILCMIKLFKDLTSVHTKKDIKYQWLLQMKKLFINYVYSIYIDQPNVIGQFITKIYICDTKMSEQCIICFNEFKHIETYVVECIECKCTYCMNCTTETFFITKRILKCAQCRKEGLILNTIALLML